MLNTLSPTLATALTHVPDPDAMNLFRTAARHAASPGGVRIDHREESRQFIDITYWITQHTTIPHDFETFFDGSDPSASPNFKELLAGTFSSPEQPRQFIFSFSEGFLRQWWEVRIQEGRLKPTPDGYVLDDEYITTVINQLCFARATG